MLKNTDIWIASYMRQEIKRLFSKKVKRPAHVIFCFVDHYEPDWNNADTETQNNRVKQWVEKYPLLARKHKDADGCYPKHTFFYPAEVYAAEHLNKLAGICREGFGEVEVHLHHDNDTEEGFRKQLEKAKHDFSGHGLLSKDKKTGELRFGFIHGNWALNNSRKDGRWCGVNNETKILKDTGCYADFTLPSAPDETQTRKINSIYYTESNGSPKPHNNGADVEAGKSGKGFMIVQGPLALNWKKRKNGIFPRIENGDITGNNHPTEDRVDLWVRQGIAVQKKHDWIFVKVHTHGAQEKNAPALLGEPLDKMFSYLESKYNDSDNFVLHYATAREMYNIIKAAEAGESGQPGDYRDYLIERNS